MSFNQEPSIPSPKPLHLTKKSARNILKVFSKSIRAVSSPGYESSDEDTLLCSNQLLESLVHSEVYIREFGEGSLLTPKTLVIRSPVPKSKEDRDDHIALSNMAWSAALFVRSLEDENWHSAMCFAFELGLHFPDSSNAKFNTLLRARARARSLQKIRQGGNDPDESRARIRATFEAELLRAHGNRDEAYAATQRSEGVSKRMVQNAIRGTKSATSRGRPRK